MFSFKDTFKKIMRNKDIEPIPTASPVTLDNLDWSKVRLCPYCGKATPENSDLCVACRKSISAYVAPQPSLKWWDAIDIVKANPGNQFIREKAVKDIFDETLLIKIATTDREYNVREAAFDKITNQHILLEIANSHDENIRASAVKRINDQTILISFATHDLSASVRMAATSKLTDQTVLSNIATKDAHAGVRITALENLTIQNILETVALQNENVNERKAALQNLSDQSTLAVIVKTDKDISLRMMAVKKISDVMCLTESQLNDQLLLCLVAAYSDSEQARNVAAEKIENISERAKFLEISKHCRSDNHVWEQTDTKRYSRNEYDGGCYSEIGYEDKIYKCKICDLQKTEHRMLISEYPNTFYGDLWHIFKEGA